MIPCAFCRMIVCSAKTVVGGTWVHLLQMAMLRRRRVCWSRLRASTSMMKRSTHRL
ncbi:hypothetical protein BOTBODRAFT_593587 [Botryobasidium botryosum FD-172 SS1]|uniref:Uncharacterized protein n=1 Tax=Botryobasidium botryosum (strain FD-172 SS1) TaxID=930990 RepID=A0A067LX19_BOTB1|nr:hypothetical protein BOTBODRAFT_593587 [Botryobasidium botryosum FD-172 SS1]